MGDHHNNLASAGQTRTRLYVFGKQHFVVNREFGGFQFASNFGVSGQDSLAVGVPFTFTFCYVVIGCNAPSFHSSLHSLRDRNLFVGGRPINRSKYHSHRNGLRFVLLWRSGERQQQHPHQHHHQDMNDPIIMSRHLNQAINRGTAL